jgi:hypothetical protein
MAIKGFRFIFLKYPSDVEDKQKMYQSPFSLSVHLYFDGSNKSRMANSQKSFNLNRNNQFKENQNTDITK